MMEPTPQPSAEESVLPPAATFMQSLSIDAGTALDIVDTAIQEVQEQAAQVRDFATRGDIVRLGQVFHSLKGATSTMEAEIFSDYFSRREAACENQSTRHADETGAPASEPLDVSADLVVIENYLQGLLQLREEIERLS